MWPDAFVYDIITSEGLTGLGVRSLGKAPTVQTGGPECEPQNPHNRQAWQCVLPGQADSPGSEEEETGGFLRPANLDEVVSFRFSEETLSQK